LERGDWLQNGEKSKHIVSLDSWSVGEGKRGFPARREPGRGADAIEVPVGGGKVRRGKGISLQKKKK